MSRQCIYAEQSAREENVYEKGARMREIRMNTGWKFWAGQDAFALVWNIPEYAADVTLPHDAMMEKPAHIGSPNRGNTGYRDGEIYTYVKELEVPEECRDKHLLLKFEGVYMNAFVYVNQQLAGKNHFGYSTFYVDLDEYLNYGEKNEIRVQVRNGAMPNSRWYSGGGIYRDVYLLVSDMTYICPDGVKIRTESADGDYAVICVDSQLKNKDFRTKRLILETKIQDSDGNTVAEERNPLVLFGGRKRTVSSRIVIEKPKLWSADEPNLYRCVSRLVYEGKTAGDETVSAFGIRTLQLDAKRGLRVNGQMVKLRGACIHHDSGLLGAATYEQAQFREIRQLKEAGFNAVRMAHNPMAPAMLRACDALGMYVMDETFDMWTKSKSDYDYSLFFEESWREDVRLMVRKDYNHPSVIMYSVGNEIPEVGTEHGSEICSEICRAIKTEDPTRYTLASINGVFAVGDRIEEVVADVTAHLRSEGRIEGNVNHFMALMDGYMDDIVVHPLITERLDMANAYTDIAGYNYMTGRYEQDGKQYPNRVIVGSETYPPEIARNWGLVRKLPHVIGDFTWTGYAYIGEAGDYHEDEAEEAVNMGKVQQLSAGGDLDICGFRRPVSYWREIVFGLRKAPYIAVRDPKKFGKPAAKNPWSIGDAQSDWTWKGQEGKPVEVQVFSPGAEVELFVNGVSAGRKKAGEEAGYRADFETVYEPGVISAAAYDENGNIMGQHEIRTAGEKRSLRLEEEPPEFCVKEETAEMPEGMLRKEEAKLTGAQGTRLKYIDISICDDQGTVAWDEKWTLETSVDAGCDIAGFGSGDICPAYNYGSGITETYHGRALLILERTEDAGSSENSENTGSGRKSVVTVRAEGHGEEKITVEW